MASNPVPNIPFKIPMTDKNGLVQTQWGAWFREVMFRVGGAVAPTNAELGADQADFSGAIENLEADVDDLQNQITNIQSGLGQGRDL